MIHVVIGTKAQVVKMAPLLRRMHEREVPFNFVFTGQHRETIRELLETFRLRLPDMTLYEGRDVASLPHMLAWSARMLLLGLVRGHRIFRRDRHGVVVTHGDTATTVVGALMGRMAGLPVAHVESGLRSPRLFHPFPEEITRRLVFRLTDLYFCPGPWALSNVARFRGEKVDTGENTLKDTLRMALKEKSAEPGLVPRSPYGLVSVHRFENIFRRRRLVEIVDVVLSAARRGRVLFILHLPTRLNLERFGLLSRLEARPAVELRPRYDYIRFIHLLRGARYLLTDGGSNQEECFYLGKPCLLLRRATERVEGMGRNVVLSGMDGGVIETFLQNPEDYARAPSLDGPSPVGIIVERLRAFAAEAGA